MRRVLCLSALLAACSSGEPTYHADVQPIVAAHCVSCHSEGNIAPFSLDSYEAIAAVAPAVRQAVVHRTMPPWHAAPGHQRYRFDWSLDQTQIDLIDRWVELGLPAGDPSERGEPIVLESAELDAIDIELEPAAPYTPGRENADEYRCFPMEWPLDTPAYLSGFEGVPGNLASVHHLLVFIVPPSSAPRIDTFVADDERPGYPCFGGVTMDGWSPAHAGETVLFNFGGQWAPGLSAQRFPEGTGLAIEPGSKIVLQVHYSTVADGDLTDLSKVRFSVREDIERYGFTVPWMDMEWVTNPPSMRIPAGSTDTVHTYESKLADNPIVELLAPDLDLSSPVWMHSVLPHMHVLGQEIWIEVARDDGVETVVHIPEYDFNWQRMYELMDPVRVRPSDTVRIRCRWDNSERGRRRAQILDPTPADVTWGEGTVEEMCIAMFYVSQPKR